MATGEIGIVSVILLVVGIFVVRGCDNRNRPALDCLASIASVAGSPNDRVPDGRCPVSRLPYVVAQKDGRESSTCPDPGRHFQWPPRFERDARRAWLLRQDLPLRGDSAPPEAGRKASYVSASLKGTNPVIEVRPRIWWRYFGGPLVQLLALLFIVSFFFQLNPNDRAPKGIIVMSLIAAIVAVWTLWISVPSVEGSHSFEFDPVRRRVTQRRFVFGAELAPKVYEACDGVSFVRTRTGRPAFLFTSYSLALVSRSGGSFPTVTDLVEGLSEGDAALGSWLRARFVPN
jgi:hypothetical protein